MPPPPPKYQKYGFTSARNPETTTVKPPRDDTAALLAGLCTQDLDYDADPLYDHEAWDRLVPGLGNPGQSFEDDAISDAELEDVVRNVEERSLGTTSEQQPKAKEVDDFFGISTQEWCEIVY